MKNGTCCTWSLGQSPAQRYGRPQETEKYSVSKCLAPCPNPSRPRASYPITPYPTGRALLGGVFPGTSCQATIAPSLRDNSQQALARCCCEMSASASRRDNADRSLARSAWKSVPLKNRPVGYGMIRYEGRLGRLNRALTVRGVKKLDK